MLSYLKFSFFKKFNISTEKWKTGIKPVKQVVYKNIRNPLN